MSKAISISNIVKDKNVKSRQLNKELFESRLQLNSLKKTPFIPFAITVNKTMEKTANSSINSKDLSFKKFTKIQKRNRNNNKNRLTDLSNDNIAKFNHNLRKYSNKKKDIAASLYSKNPKTTNNSIINKKLTTSNFINNNNYSTIKTYEDKNPIKKNEIKIQKKNNDKNKTIKCKIIRGNNIDSSNNYKRSGLLPLNLNTSSFKNRLMKNYNKSGIIGSSINNNCNSRNIFLEKNLNKKTKDTLNKKISQKNSLNKNKKKDLNLNFFKEKLLNNSNQFSKCKLVFLDSYKKHLQIHSLYNTNKNNKTIYLRNNNNDIKNKNRKSNLQINNFNINNYINCNISYINNLNKDNKFKNNRTFNNINLTYNNDTTNKFFYKKNMDKYDKNKKKFEKINIKFEKKTNDKNKESINKRFGDDNSDSMFENDIQEISKNDIEDSKEDSGLLSFDKIEDLIVYNNMKDINKKDDYLFFKEDRKIFNNKYAKVLSKYFL